MGLDAWVFCDCIERGRIRTPHPYPDLLFVAQDGGPSISSDNLEKQIAHDSWEWQSPCEHKECTLIHHRIGNSALVGWIRKSIAVACSDPEKEYPVIWNKVIYSGVHGGDFLILDDVRLLESELPRLRQLFKIPQDLQNSEINMNDALKQDDDKRMLAQFIQQMMELTLAALTVNKPICF